MTYLREKLSQKPAYQRREDNRHEMTWQQLRKWGSWDLGIVRGKARYEKTNKDFLKAWVN